MASTIRQRRFNRPIIKGRIVPVSPSLAEKQAKREVVNKELRRELRRE